MLAFSARWIKPILSGAKTVTLRKWPKARVKVGGIYDAGTIGFPRKVFAKVRVTGIRRIKLADVDEKIARRDGARSADEVRGYWAKQKFKPSDELWLIEFKVTKPPEAANT